MNLNDLINQATPFAPSDAQEGVSRLQQATQPQQASAGSLEDDTDKLPPEDAQHNTVTVFVPGSAHLNSDNQRAVSYELRELEAGSGTAGIAVYTSLEKLVTELGADQVYVDVDIFTLIRQVAGRAPIVLDPSRRDDTT